MRTFEEGVEGRDGGPIVVSFHDRLRGPGGRVLQGDRERVECECRWVDVGGEGRGP